MIRRAGTALIFTLLGFVSLVFADQLRQWVCSHFLDGCVLAAGCPIDTCAPNTGQHIVRIIVYFGPALVFGASAFLFGRRSRRIHSWLTLLAALVAIHALVMAAASLA